MFLGNAKTHFQVIGSTNTSGYMMSPFGDERWDLDDREKLKKLYKNPNKVPLPPKNSGNQQEQAQQAQANIKPGEYGTQLKGQQVQPVQQVQNAGTLYQQPGIIYQPPSMVQQVQQQAAHMYQQAQAAQQVNHMYTQAQLGQMYQQPPPTAQVYAVPGNPYQPLPQGVAYQQPAAGVGYQQPAAGVGYQQPAPGVAYQQDPAGTTYQHSVSNSSPQTPVTFHPVQKPEQSSNSEKNFQPVLPRAVVQPSLLPGSTVEIVKHGGAWKNARPSVLCKMTTLGGNCPTAKQGGQCQHERSGDNLQVNKHQQYCNHTVEPERGYVSKQDATLSNVPQPRNTFAAPTTPYQLQQKPSQTSICSKNRKQYNSNNQEGVKHRSGLTIGGGGHDLQDHVTQSMSCVSPYVCGSCTCKDQNNQNGSTPVARSYTPGEYKPFGPSCPGERGTPDGHTYRPLI